MAAKANVGRHRNKKFYPKKIHLAHLVIEVAYQAIERRPLATPIEFDPATGVPLLAFSRLPSRSIAHYPRRSASYAQRFAEPSYTSR